MATFIDWYSTQHFISWLWGFNTRWARGRVSFCFGNELETLCDWGLWDVLFGGTWDPSGMIKIHNAQFCTVIYPCTPEPGYLQKHVRYILVTNVLLTLLCGAISGHNCFWSKVWYISCYISYILAKFFYCFCVDFISDTLKRVTFVM